jgi:hypothetical protein
MPEALRTRRQHRRRTGLRGPAAQRLGRRRSLRGLSLAELLVGVALGLAMVVLVLQGYANAGVNSRSGTSNAEMQTNGRYALEVLRRELRHAALSPLLWDASQLTVNATVTARDYGCGAGLTANLMQGLQAFNDTNPYEDSCLTTGTDREWSRGDVLLLRRLASTAVTTTVTNAPYVRVSYGSGHLYLGGETAASLPAPAYDHRLATDVYFINAWTRSADESPRVPALYRLTLGSGANPTLVPELVASNVEHFQLQMGVADTSGNLRYFDPNSVPDWGRVMSVRLWLLLRASEPEADLASTTYTLGDVTYAPDDHFRRAVLTSTINVRNR